MKDGETTSSIKQKRNERTRVTHRNTGNKT